MRHDFLRSLLDPNTDPGVLRTVEVEGCGVCSRAVTEASLWVPDAVTREAQQICGECEGLTPYEPCTTL